MKLTLFVNYLLKVLWLDVPDTTMYCMKMLCIVNTDRRLPNTLI